ncbi:MAG: outer membrane beta-barrel protein [Gammaproteobacteria bacterium]|nr:outer membrane beta-barrel protein [Gammaproteobacteria bacterium]
MIQRQLQNKRFIKLSLITLTLITSHISLANDYDNTFLPDPRFEASLRPFVALGGGIAVTSKLGESKTFPIQNPITDQFYSYNPHSPTQTAAIGDIFLGAEWVMHPRWALQLGINYNQTSAFNVKGTLTQGASVASQSQFTYQYKIEARQILLEGKLLYHCQDQFHPYLLLGLGGSINTGYGFITNIPPTLTFTRQYNNATKHSFSYRLGIGADFDMTPNIRLGLGYNFANFGKVNLGSASIENIPVSRTLTQASMGVNEIVGQITFLN